MYTFLFRSVILTKSPLGVCSEFSLARCCASGLHEQAANKTLHATAKAVVVRMFILYFIFLGCSLPV